MATDVEKLVVQMSADFRSFKREFAVANGVARKTFNQIERQAWAADKTISRVGHNMARSLMVPLASIGGALAIREVGQYADAWTEAGNKISAASVVAGRGARSLEDIRELSDSSRAGFEETIQLYSRVLRATKDVANSEEEVARATDIVNKAFKAGGAATSEMTAGVLQLSQGLASGMLQGDELRSVRENAPLLADAIAKYFGTTIGGLKDLGAEGKLTSDKVFKAILGAQSEVEAAFSTTNATIHDGVTKVRNALIQYVGGADQSLGATHALTQGLNALADNFESIADTGLKVATVIAGALVGRTIVGGIANVAALTRGIGGLVAVARSGTGLGGLVASLGGLSAVAGPIALLLGGTAALALNHFASESARAAARSADVNEMLVEMGIRSRDAADGIDEATEAQKKLSTAEGIAEKADTVEKFNEQLVITNDHMVQLLAHLTNIAQADDLGGPVSAQKQFAIEAAKTTSAFIDQKISAKQLKEELDALTVRFPDFARLANSAIQYANALDEVRRGAARLALEHEPTPGQVTPRGKVGAGRRAVIAKEGIGSAYISEQERLLSLTKQQRDVEEEIASIKRDVSTEGGTITDDAAERLARLRVDSRETKKTGDKKTPEETFQDSLDNVQLRMANLREETALQSTLNPLINDYGYALEKLRVQQQLENDAVKAGLELTPDRKKAIADLAEGMAMATSEMAKLAEAQDATSQSMQDWFNTGRSITRGFIDDLIESKSAAEALGNAFSQLGSHLIDLGLNGLFGTGGDNFGLIGKAFGFANGGIAAHGKPKMFANGGVSKTAAIFGEAGPEAAVPLPDGRRIPVDLRMPQVASGGGGVNVHFAPTIDARGADPAGLARVERQLQKMQAELVPTIKKTVSQRKQNMW